jgi:hypothetical protein
VARTDAVAIRCPASFRVRRSMYHALAHGVARAPRPAGVLFEALASDRRPWAIVRPARVLSDLDGSFRAVREPVDGGTVPPDLRPPSSSVDRIGVLTPSGGGTRWTPEGVPLPAPALEQLLGPGGWLGFQTLWVTSTDGNLWVTRRFRYSAPTRSELLARFDRVAGAVAYDWANVIGGPAMVRRPGIGARSGWRRRSLLGIPREAWLVRGPDSVDSTAEVRWVGSAAPGGPPAGHEVVFGSSGAGKTTYLARRAAEAIARGESVVALDLHGDLAPSVVARLSPEALPRVIAVDAGERPVSGIAALSGAAGDDRAVALFVAAVKRLSADGTDVYWGFRLERIFDSFVRLVQESGGSLLDLYDLLTSRDRRDAARLSTRRPELAGFLEELEPVVRRTPDFLWSAANRISKVALVPALAELLAPAHGGIPVESSISEGRSVLVRLPFARLGPEAATLAGTLVLARIFLGLAGRQGAERPARPVFLVLDEVQGFSPRLVAEVLAESRKFGIRAVVATQYPERLAPEVRSAAAGASTHFVTFRVPPPSAVEAGSWLGLDRSLAERLLPSLPPGHGVELDPETGGLLPVAPGAIDPSVAPDPEDAWRDAVSRSRVEYGADPTVVRADGPDDPSTERLLLAVLAAEEEGAPLEDARVVAAALALPGTPLDPETLGDRWASIRSRGWFEFVENRTHLTRAGARTLGLGSPTMAARESPEHRRLLLRTFRIFARRGYRIEILQQGRFDTTLPDARFRQLPHRPESCVPEELARAIDGARHGWAWRYFGGRDVHVEAEVSGALRAERIRHGWSKAEGRGAFVLFVVGDAARARRVWNALLRANVPRDRARVWTLPDRSVPKL